MTQDISPADLSPDTRLYEIATLLAAGVLRMRRAPAQGSSVISPASHTTCLEVPPPSRADNHHGGLRKELR